MLQPRPQPDPSQQLGRRAARRATRPAGDHQRQRDVLQRRELGQQVVKLVDETQMAVADPTALGLAGRADIMSGNANRAGAGIIEPAKQLQQGALAHA